MKDLYFCAGGITPLISMIFAKHRDKKADLLISVDPSMLSYLDKTLFDNIIFLKNMDNKSIKELILNSFRFKYFTKIPNLEQEYDNFYVFKDVSYYNQLLFKKINYKKLIYLEEGFSLTMVTSTFSYNEKTLKGDFYRYLFGLKHYNHYLSNLELSSAYIFFADFLKEYPIKLIDIRPILEESKAYLEKISNNIRVNQNYLNPDIIILGQAFGYEAKDTVKPIEEYLNSLNLKDKKVILKPHPSDPLDKYNELLYMFPNIIFMSDSYNIPYELLHKKIKPKVVVSYQSTVLITSPIFLECKIVSLLPLLEVKSKEEWIELIKELNFLKMTNIELFGLKND